MNTLRERPGKGAQEAYVQSSGVERSWAIIPRRSETDMESQH